jgi:hypothetical protein
MERWFAEWFTGPCVRGSIAPQPPPDAHAAAGKHQGSPGDGADTAGLAGDVGMSQAYTLIARDP